MESNFPLIEGRPCYQQVWWTNPHLDDTAKMDPERHTRRRLIEALSGHFICLEEVPLRHAIFHKHVIRCDVLAIPLDARFKGLTLAFEVKEPQNPEDTSFWKRAIRQASDYVYATVEPQFGQGRLAGRRISSSFVYPYLWPKDSAGRMIANYFDFATYLRVGRAFHEDSGKGRLALYLGNQVWRSDKGFTSKAEGDLMGKRQLGSRKIDLLCELDGINHS